MSRNLRRHSTSKALSRRSLFGPPPIIHGEKAEDYYALHERVLSAVQPTNFIEEIWIRDVVDSIWTLLRLRRIEAAFLAAEMWEKANDKASTLATEKAKLKEGMDQEQKEEMNRLMSNDSGLTWEELVAQNPRANEKFQELYQSALDTVDPNPIQAKVMIRHLDKIEQIQHLIMITQRRFDAIIHEMDRHRFTQKQLNSVQDVLDAEFKIASPKINGHKTANKKAA